MGRLAKITHG